MLPKHAGTVHKAEWMRDVRLHDPILLMMNITKPPGKSAGKERIVGG